MMAFLPLVILFGGLWLFFRVLRKRGYLTENHRNSGCISCDDEQTTSNRIGYDGEYGIWSEDSSVW